MKTTFNFMSLSHSSRSALVLVILATILALETTTQAEDFCLEHCIPNGETWFGLQPDHGSQAENSTFVGDYAGAIDYNPNCTAIGASTLTNGPSSQSTVIGAWVGTSANSGSDVLVGGQAARSAGNTDGNVAAGAYALNIVGSYGMKNVAIGVSALSKNGSGSSNVAVGANALFNSTTENNTAMGEYSLYSNTTGIGNTGAGQSALFSNTTGGYNTAIGYSALSAGSTSSSNTAVGANALHFNTASSNTATGIAALYQNTSGFNNTARGIDALFSNTIGGYNVATGANSLVLNSAGAFNTANGRYALYHATSGANTGVGAVSMYNSTSGVSNTVLGYQALFGNTTGGSNIAVGESAGFSLTTGSNNIEIGNKGVAGESNTIRIGKKGTQTTTVIAGISGTTVGGGVGVVINDSGRLGIISSSARYKKNVQSMGKASESILSLEPVTFRYKKELDPEGIPQFGLIAEEVAKVNPALVARDEAGKPYSVRYEAVNAMLLNEFLKDHRKIENQPRINEQQETGDRELQAAMADHEKEIMALKVELQLQAAQIDKVSDQLADSQPMSRLVINE